MRRELKLRVKSLADIEKRIVELGGTLVKEDVQEYTYFNQPIGHVLKLTKKKEGTFKTVLQARDGKFDIISSDLVEDEQKMMAELSAEHGIRRKLVNHRKVYVNGDEEQSLNDIKARQCVCIAVVPGPRDLPGRNQRPARAGVFW